MAAHPTCRHQEAALTALWGTSLGLQGLPSPSPGCPCPLMSVLPPSCPAGLPQLARATSGHLLSGLPPLVWPPWLPEGSCYTLSGILPTDSPVSEANDGALGLQQRFPKRVPASPANWALSPRSGPTPELQVRNTGRGPCDLHFNKLPGDCTRA